ncbi:MAG: hypothetical protein LAO51_14645 [Acidobacteriia bacterium]|nr:hypothetical protein [Terriglobia bacterium]
MWCLAGSATNPSLACSSCGCSLNSDWVSQGYTVRPGFQIDFRYDDFDQDQLRNGTETVDRGPIVLPSDREIQRKTINRNTMLNLEYSRSSNWGVDLQLPYYDRYHTTIAPGDVAESMSHSRSVGDLRAMGRYQGFSEGRQTGVLFGLKLATGSIHETFRAGPQAGELLDRGLQPGTGTTDLLVGAYHFGELYRDWGYFVQALLQQPLRSREAFRPGTGLNVNVGARYTAGKRVTPHLQINVRAEKREAGDNADVDNSGATLVYLSPGLTIQLVKDFALYGFLQAPILQRVNGYQIEPRYTASIGVHFRH